MGKDGPFSVKLDFFILEAPTVSRQGGLLCLSVVEASVVEPK